MPAFAVNGQRRLGLALAIGVGCVVALGAAASIIFGQVGADWLRLSLVAQVIVVGVLALVLAHQIVVLRRTQGSLVAANTDLAGAQASLETNNRMLRATQAELKRARQQLIDGLEGSADGFALYDAEDRLVVCNSRYRDLFGLHPDMLRPGTPFVDILRAHVSAGRIEAAIGREEEWITARLAQHRDPQGLFERNIDGHWFRFSDRPTSEGGTVTIFTEIDELKQREQRLRENQSILQSILDHIPVTVSITDRERRIVLLNRRIEDLYGVHQAEVVGRPIDEVRPRRYSSDSAVRDHFCVIETGEPVLGREDDYADGRDTESWITSVVPIKGEDGSVRYVLRTTFEVPQLARANRELADYRAFLIEAERQAKIASWQQTPEDNYRTIWSENVEAVIGYTAAQIQDDAMFLAVIHADDRERIAQLFRSLDDTARSYDAEYRVVRADGRTIWVRGITKVELDQASEVVRYIGSLQDITESKRAEQALRDSETLLKEAQRRAKLAYWLWEPGAGEYALAPECEQIIGVPLDILKTDVDFLPFIHPEDRPWVAETYRRQVALLEPYTAEYRWCRPDGQVIWLRDMCEQEHDPSGRVRRLVGTIQDVTEQKRSEEALRENQALLLAAQRRARIAYWLEDTGRGQAYVASDFMAEVLGVPADAVPTTDGDHVKLVHPEDRPRVAHAYERAVAGKAPYAIEYRVFRGDGSIGWLRELAEFQPGPGGKGHRLIGTIQDITEQKTAETALRDSEARMRAFMDHAPVAMSVKDLDGRFTMLNRHDGVFLGHSAEDAIGRRTADLLSSEDAALVAAHERAVLAAGEPVERELHFSSGSPIEWSYEVKFPVRDAGGTVVAIGGVALDISSQKRMEQALRHSEEQLREVVHVSNIGIFDHDHVADTITWSAEQRKNYGFGADEAVTLPKFVECVPPEDRAWVFAAIERAHDPAGDGRFDIEHRIIRRDGAIRWLDTRSQTFFAGEGAARRPVRTIGAVIDITDRKNAELALKESEARLRDSEMRMRAFMDHAPVGMFVKDLDGRFTMLNRHDAKFFGRQPEDIVGRRSADFLERADAAIVEAHDRSVVATGAPVERELHFASRPWVEWSYEVKFPIRDAGGAVVGIGGVAVDISALKRTEQALRDSEARMRAFMDHAPMVIYLKDTEGRYQLVNREFEQVEGVSEDQLRGKTVFDVLPPEYAELFAASDYEILAGGEMVARENHDPARVRYRDSLAVKFPVRDGSGNLVGIGGFTQDITERKRAENALRESEARLRRAQLQAKLACWSWDLDTDSYVWAPGSGLALGLSDADLPAGNADYSALIHPADRDALWCLYAEVEAGRDAFTAEFRIQRPDGEVIWVEEIGEVERDAGGRRASVNGTLQDVTERKRADAALRESEARLRAFLDHAPFAMYLKDTDLRYQLVNRAVEQFQGMTAAEICGRTPAQIYPPALAERFIAEDHEVLARGVPVMFEYSDQTLASYADSLTVRFPVRDSGGRIVAIGGITQDVSERKQAERALRESEARMRSFMDNAPVAVAIKDLERRFVLLNNRIELAFGRPAEEMIGRRTIDLSQSEGAASVDALEQQVVATGKAATAEVFFPERTALPWTFEVKFPIRDATGAMVAIGGVAVDITDRKKAELALAESEARFRSFMDNAPFDMIVKDLQGRYLMVNRGVEAAWRRASGEILGRSLPELSHSEGVAQVEAIEREVMETGHIVAREVHFTDLGPEWTYEVKFPIRDAAGSIIALGGAAIDISDRKRAQMALAESEMRLRRAQQQARLAYWSWQFATALTPEEFRWSPGSGELLGLADAEMPKYDTDSMNITHPDDRDRLKRLYDEVRAGLDDYAVEYRVRRRDGGVVWVREVAEVVRDADGRRVGVEGTMQDITDQRALEEQLRQAQKMESIGQLTGGIAHDFNNLMAVILGNLELLAEDLPGNAAAQQKIHTAIRSTLRGSDLTQRLLAFARQQSLAPKLTRIDDLIRAMRDLLLRPLGPAIEATFALASDRWPAEIDQARLETSLLNLVINARDAMPDGGKLTVATSNVIVEPGDARQIEGLAPGEYVLIAVGDSGEGMTEEVRERAFDPFFTTKGIGKGTGLGLSMVYGFVKQSGGHVEIASEVGHGTTVKIYLPAAKGAAVAEASVLRKG